jgi:hypothetical protein
MRETGRKAAIRKNHEATATMRSVWKPLNRVRIDRL